MFWLQILAYTWLAFCTSVVVLVVIAVTVLGANIDLYLKRNRGGRCSVCGKNIRTVGREFENGGSFHVDLPHWCEESEDGDKE